MIVDKKRWTCATGSGNSPNYYVDVEWTGAAHQRWSPILAEFADKLSSWGLLDGAVVDKTGIAGTYDFTLDFMPEQPGVGPSTDVPPPEIGEMATPVS